MTIEFDTLFSNTLKFKTALFTNDIFKPGNIGLCFVFYDAVADHYIRVFYKRENGYASGYAEVQSLFVIGITLKGVKLSKEDFFNCFVKDIRYQTFYREMNEAFVEKLLQDGGANDKCKVDVREILLNQHQAFNSSQLMTLYSNQLEMLKILFCGNLRLNQVG